MLLWYNLGYLYEKISLGIPFTDVRFFEVQTTTLISQFAAAVLGLTLNQAAYSAEIIRGGILSVDQGQLEAAAALGIPAWRRSTRSEAAMPSRPPMRVSASCCFSCGVSIRRMRSPVTTLNDVITLRVKL